MQRLFRSDFSSCMMDSHSFIFSCVCVNIHVEYFFFVFGLVLCLNWYILVFVLFCFNFVSIVSLHRFILFRIASEYFLFISTSRQSDGTHILCTVAFIRDWMSPYAFAWHHYSRSRPCIHLFFSLSRRLSHVLHFMNYLLAILISFQFFYFRLIFSSISSWPVAGIRHTIENLF